VYASTARPRVEYEQIKVKKEAVCLFWVGGVWKDT
jgi:hypothetical protein